MATLYEQKFRDVLALIFQLDQADLDFGIYRIMNQKRKDIEAFLNNRLIPEVTAILKGNAKDDTEKLKEELQKLVSTLEAAGVNPDESTKVQELKTKISAGTDISAMENEVFSHLTKFFSRYYEGGDFISKRRYKDDTYAIPYSGEEVKLYWANADQYYIKTSEYFKNYSFVLPSCRRKVHFVLRDAETEQNNNKAANNMERRFQLGEENFIEEVDGELNIFFTYELMPKTTKQDALIKDAEEKVRPVISAEYASFAELVTTKAPTDKNKERTLLMKHLQDYTAKNNFDYFIHKDLGGFLRRELDFYIKNEVMFLDDLDANHIMEHLAQVKAIKRVGEKIITFLAQLEDFQKKLWLKKKFVVGCDYCITLDRIPHALYPAVIANEAQRKEWVRLFAINEIKGDMMTEGYSEPLTEKFLEENPFLVLDTKFFDAEFKHKVVESMENVDEECNGLLINSENFQALELLQEKYREAVKCVYIDPPYNTGSDNSFAYKDNYQHSSWASMMNDRSSLMRSLMGNLSTLWVSTDDGEYANLKQNLDVVFGADNFVADIIWNSRKSVSNDALVSGSINHTTLFTKNMLSLKAGKADFKIDANEEGFINPDNDPNGPWKLDPMDAPGIRENLSYGILNPNTNETFYPASGRHWRFEEPETLHLLSIGRILFGKKGTTKPGYKRYKFEALGKGDAITSLWDDVKTTAEGTKLLLNLFGNSLPKEFVDGIKPKPVEFINKIVNVSTTEKNIILDCFCGSATTGHATLTQNRKGKNHKYILCDVNYYFDILPKPRIEKVIYSEDWKDGKPVSRKGISQCFKYLRLEQYEDTLNNLQPKQTGLEFKDGKAGFEENYLLRYMLDTETKGDLFNLEWFVHPFSMSLKTTKDNELIDTPVDMVETFNYLIGLNVETMRWPKDGYCVVEGTTHIGNERTLVIWRDCEKVSNEALNEFFRKQAYSTTDSEFDKIYVNGDNTLPNIKTDEEHWKVVLIEKEFKKRMFE